MASIPALTKTHEQTQLFNIVNLARTQQDVDVLRNVKESVTGMTESTSRFGTNNKSGRDANRNRESMRPVQPARNQRRKDEDMNDEDRARYERALSKQSRKTEVEIHYAVLDEQVPKPTDKEVMLDKRKSTEGLS